jgi:hypothetical protein
MQALRGIRALLIPDLGIRMINVTPLPRFIPRTHWIGGWLGPLYSIKALKQRR